MGSVEPLEFENLQVECKSFKYKKDIFLKNSKLNEIIAKKFEVFIGYMPIKCNMTRQWWCSGDRLERTL